MNKHYRLYMDESFPGDFSFDNPQPRKDGMNCYCFAGVLIAEENIEPIRRAYKEFVVKWGIDYPLHYVNIRGKRGNFDWLTPDKATSNRDPQTFIDAYHDFMFSLPYEVFGCVIDRVHFEETNSYFTPNQMRSGVRAHSFEMTIALAALWTSQISLKIYSESAGKKEDRILNDALIYLKEEGYTHPVLIEKTTDFDNFDKDSHNFKDSLPEKLMIVEKSDPFVQVADFCAFIIAKSHYDKDYRPFLKLRDKVGDIAYHPSEDLDA